MSDFEIGVRGAGAGTGEDDIVIDLEHMFDAVLPDDLYVLDDGNNSSSSYSSSFVPDPSPSAPDASFSMIEEFLFNDDYSGDPTIHPHLLSAADGFLSDILLDSPLPLDSSSSSGADHLSPEIDPLNSNRDAKDSEEGQQQEANLRHHQLPPPPPFAAADEAEWAGVENPHIDNINNADDDADDPIIAKKRKRQLRNRDAAVRSRERKKMHVKDLEMKSRYYEAECRRLGMLLQCYLAENHALRLSLHNNGEAFDASTTKQESAVLLLESLLLGSLLWFLGIIGLFNLPRQLLSILEAAGVENVGHKNQGSLALGEAGSNVFGTLEVVPSFMMSKRCRGSRRKMRCSIEAGLRGSVDVFSFFLSMTSFYCVFNK